jgi:hypothetical protein
VSVAGAGDVTPVAVPPGSLAAVSASRRPSPRAARVMVALVVLVFLVQIVALALGWIEVALACAGVYVVAWFALRGWMGRPSGG